jgi:hypothetical protein
MIFLNPKSIHQLTKFLQSFFLQIHFDLFINIKELLFQNVF